MDQFLEYVHMEMENEEGSTGIKPRTMEIKNEEGFTGIKPRTMKIKNEEGSTGIMPRRTGIMPRRIGMPLLADVSMKEEKTEIAMRSKEGINNRRTSSTTTEEYYFSATSSFVEPVKVAEENLMDRRLYAHATTQGDDVDGFIKILKSISSENDQLEQSKILGRISLHIAASCGHHDDTALHIAARRRDLPLVKILMNSCRGCLSSRDLEKAEADLLTLKNKEGNTVLHEALINHCKEEEVVEIIKLAKTHHDHPQLANNEGKSPLYLAAQASYFHVVEAIATSQPEEPIDNGATSQLEEPIDNGAGKAKPALHAAILAKNMGIFLHYLYLIFNFFKLKKHSLIATILGFK